LPDSRSHIFYSTPGPDDRLGVDYDRQGRLSVEALREMDLPTGGLAFVCGPQLFMDGMSDALAACGIAPADIHTERFGAYAAITPGIDAAESSVPHPPPGPAGSGPVVQFARSALSASWRSSDTTLLEFAEACDVPARWSCRTGVCHTCETALLSGRVDYATEPLEPPADGNVLLCISRPAEDVVIDL
jgi:ferredoxin